ncbi:MAG: TetR/AcrR family transcriptional regulator [Comamonadaceae bacterium]|jgi:AcrR family transcriptional regulator|uniref:TetR/AcrR family transcriptional regulator n=1 Tax=Hydrogenophaga borbori TaxID=2294117 RepID=A0A372EER3_9BURK|nr:TetR/AcrR family transcriptional regulator [Hydrogenophaga borbori]NCT97313.1 TetR/AcrR family transcriptional regulator [Comamonadaceae bacterium]RFP76854.1 TetR/AcrR family transcriptional regulator [Hydrogenophaga borbori]
MDAQATPAPERRSRGRPRKTADERDDGNRRQALLRAAARLFRQQGFAATSTRDIAAAVGMRSGSPFYHFENKEALLAAVMEEGMQRALRHQRERMDAAVAAAPGPLSASECLRVLVRGHFDNLLGPESDHIPVMLYEWRWLAPQPKRVVSELMAEYEAVWVPVLQALRREGALRGDTALARLLIFGALNWTAQWYDPEGPTTLDGLTEAALQLFVKDME